MVQGRWWTVGQAVVCPLAVKMDGNWELEIGQMSVVTFELSGIDCLFPTQDMAISEHVYTSTWSISTSRRRADAGPDATRPF